MIEELYKNIYRIGVPLPGNPLKELNSYFIKGKESDLLIDTGFRREPCRKALQEGLDELGSDPARRDVLLTHLHSDHSGLADLMVDKSRRVYIHEKDLALLRRFRSTTIPEFRYVRFIEEGFTKTDLDEMFRTNPAMTEAMDSTACSFVPLRDGDPVPAGDFTLKTLFVPGHTPGNCMFYLQDEQILFSGDHVLFDITPNITYWPGVADSLGDYISSLKKYRDLPVSMTLPGHRQTGTYRERVESLLEHHARRLSEAYAIVKENPGLNACEIAGLMKWKIRAASWETFPVVQKWFAVGECLSHLDYHMQRGRLRAETGEDGIRRHYAL